MKLPQKYIISEKDSPQVQKLKKEVNSLLNYIKINSPRPHRYFTKEHQPLKGKGLKLRSKILSQTKDQSMEVDR